MGVGLFILKYPLISDDGKADRYRSAFPRLHAGFIAGSLQGLYLFQYCAF